MVRKGNLNYLSILKRRIEEKSGIRIYEFNQCRDLSAVFSKVKINISAHTIGRFYGIMKKNHKPYLSTLNLMANYLDYHSFDTFCQFEEKLLIECLSGIHQFSTGEFSFTALELAIAQSKWKEVCKLLESYQIDFRKQSITDFLGNSVRNHPERNSFLKALADIENGRHLFYESFVDEDDMRGYYSEALLRYYSKVKNDFGSKFFIESYLVAKNIYSNCTINSLSKINNLHKEINPDNIHFHHLSRWYELRILLAHRENKPFGFISEIILEMLERLQNYHPYDRRWILARSLKAIIHSGIWEQSIQLDVLKNEIFICYQSMAGQVESVADLIIQLCAHSLWKYDKLLHPIFKLEEEHLNESNLRLAIEGATALLYAKQPVKKIIHQNLKPFSERTGNSWVLNLI